MKRATDEPSLGLPSTIFFTLSRGDMSNLPSIATGLFPFLGLGLFHEFVEVSSAESWLHFNQVHVRAHFGAHGRGFDPLSTVCNLYDHPFFIGNDKDLEGLIFIAFESDIPNETAD